MKFSKGFKISLGNYSMVYFEANDCDSWKECTEALKEEVGRSVDVGFEIPENVFKWLKK